jgi:dienelactone hydrolase
MKRFPLFGLCAAALLSFQAAPLVASPAGTAIEFASLDPGQSYKLHGTLFLPEDGSPIHPALVVIHGTLGIDSRNEFYREAILKAGVAVFEVDFKTGVFATVFGRPKPSAFMPMTFAALKELRKLKAIDPERIGIMGFSLGGHMTVDAAFEANRKAWLGEGKGFAAHVAFYPVCRPYLKQEDLRMTGAPMIILYGAEDTYGEGESVPAFKHLLLEKAKFEVTTVPYPGAHHAFNLNAPSEDHWDPVAVGHKSHTAWSPEAANDSRIKVVEFLGRTLTAH